MAKQLGERFGVSGCFSDLEEMLQATSPDVVHITTPPQSHFSLAKQCLQSGSHVYLEKPFTITAEEAESLIELAESRGLKITVGHNYLFSRCLKCAGSRERDFLAGSPLTWKAIGRMIWQT
jgi:predicted dehydrogenase